MLTKPLKLILSIIMLFSAAVANSQEQNELAYFKYVPDKWRSEIINFPLDFAPSLKYKGRLELLFSPGMFKDESEEFLSYGFIWAIEGSDVPTPEQLEQDLKTYYYGLQSVVSEGKLKAKANSRVWLDESSSGSDLSYLGIVEWTEPFVTKSAQKLSLKVTFRVNKENNQWQAFFRVSPQQIDHSIWTKLEELPIN